MTIQSADNECLSTQSQMNHLISHLKHIDHHKQALERMEDPEYRAESHGNLMLLLDLAIAHMS